ncbi:low molecular weight phosphatase family protein [Nocardia nova]|nr:low molecular weight phosphatase family protein [Nocardia nova]MDN2496994.1 low molecular weight phosphatase family protein [Nocardia nova]
MTSPTTRPAATIDQAAALATAADHLHREFADNFTPATGWSGGTTHGDRIEPGVVDTMADVGIDIIREFPKPWTEEIVHAADIVVSMGCGDACPTIPGGRCEEWDLPDLTGADPATIRDIRDAIEERVRALIADLDLTNQPTPAFERPCPVMASTPSVLFVCVHNAGRSQMAQGFLTHLAGNRVEVRSAGTEPADTINPAAIQAMAEIGIDITAQTPKILTPDTVQTSDIVITMGCGDTCPYFPGVDYRDWKLDDPAGLGIDAVRPIRDQIRTHIEQLIAELLPTQTTN